VKSLRSRRTPTPSVCITSIKALPLLPSTKGWLRTILPRRHKMSYYEGMAMSSLNISLPEALKDYIEGQVNSGDWSTPSEYIRELIRQDKERRLRHLEQDLLAGVKSGRIEIPVAEIRKKGLVAALRERARRK